MARVALVGFGTVGRSVARILCDQARPAVTLSHICNRQVDRKVVDWVPETVTWTSDFGDVLRSDAEIVVEAIGGLDPAAAWIRQALEAGKSVVTANKQVMARAGAELTAVAAAHGRQLLFEAAVAGGVPVIRAIREGLAGDRLRRVRGVLNGTCNYVLTRMETAGIPFDDAVREAQAHGYAEADPTADVDGDDARAKLAILADAGLGRRVPADAIPTRSIRPVEPVDFVYARQLGCTVRQVSWAEVTNGADGRVTASVQPMLVPASSPLARAEGSQNVVVVDGVYGGETAFRGFGAGGDPTAVAIVSDVAAIVRSGGAAPAPWTAPDAAVAADFTAPHYLRFVIVDRGGIIATLADVVHRHGMNVDSVLQEPGWPKSALPFVMTLDPCPADEVRSALAEIGTCDFHARPPVWMPILPRGDAAS